MLDRLDLKILEVIQSNGRISNKELATQINLSPSACHQRFVSLQADGWISEFNAVVDIERLCSPVQCISSLTLSNHSPDVFKRLEEEVNRIPEALEAFTVSGVNDFIVRFACTSMNRYMHISNSLLDLIPEVSNISTHVVMKESKTFRGYPIKELIDSPLQR